MARVLTWDEPDDDNTTLVEISRASSESGTYSVLAEINATSDGEVKTTANTWVLSYTDVNGTRSHYYKLRFYDSVGESWSAFSDPVTSVVENTLCTVDDVKGAVDTVGRWTDAEIYSVIQIVDENIYNEMYTPIKAVYSDIEYDNSTGTTYKTFFVGEQKLYRVERVFAGTTSMSELTYGTDYTEKLDYGMIRILPYASSGYSLDKSGQVEIQFVPKIYNRLATYKSALMLLEQIDTISGGTSSKELEVMQGRLNKIEEIMMNQTGVLLSSDFKNYDSVYGVNRKKITQDYDRNKYIGKF